MTLIRYCKRFIIICLAGVAILASPSQVSAQPFTSNTYVRASVSERYDDPGLLKMIFMGNNYRKEWATEVTFPQFDLAASGMKITGLGGGWQTKSLQLIDKDSTQWVLRTVDKELSTGVPKKYRNFLYISVMQDMVSAAYPYAPLVITGLAQATKVPATDPVYYYVPYDTAFGQYKDVFAGKICMLERREVLPGDPVTVSTTGMLDEFLKNGYSTLDMQAYLKARLLDMLIGDWDRHQDQWIWSDETRNGNRKFVALPKDRDQAFFFSGGLLVKLIPIAGYKHFVGFRGNTEKIKSLNAKSLHLDKLILNGLNKHESIPVIVSFITSLTDSVIKDAVKRLPPEIYSMSGDEIEKKLIGRRNTLAADAVKYLDHLSGSVVLYGTDQKDHFNIKAERDSIIITITNNGVAQTALKRSFHIQKTQEISLLGFGGNDEFTLTGELPPSISLKIDGGAGTNTYPSMADKNITRTDSGMTVASYRPVLHEQLKITAE